jgi:hypothetical protein
MCVCWHLKTDQKILTKQSDNELDFYFYFLSSMFLSSFNTNNVLCTIKKINHTVNYLSLDILVEINLLSLILNSVK